MFKCFVHYVSHRVELLMYEAAQEAFGKSRLKKFLRQVDLMKVACSVTKFLSFFFFHYFDLLHISLWEKKAINVR